MGLDKTLPDSPLASLPNVTLLRAGDGFTLAGYDAAAAAVRWGRVALDGTLTQETSFALAPPVVGPVFAATGKNAPGDQLVAVGLVGSATVNDGYDLMATVHTLGDAAPAAPVVLNTLDAFPTGTDPAAVVRAVIRIGRRRISAASISASRNARIRRLGHPGERKAHLLHDLARRRRCRRDAIDVPRRSRVGQRPGMGLPRGASAPYRIQLWCNHAG